MSKDTDREDYVLPKEGPIKLH